MSPCNHCDGDVRIVQLVQRGVKLLWNFLPAGVGSALGAGASVGRGRGGSSIEVGVFIKLSQDSFLSPEIKHLAA